MKNLSVDQAIKIFSKLAEDVYSPLWELIEDFLVNGHLVQTKHRDYWYSVHIDRQNYRISGNCSYIVDGKEYTALEYVKAVLEKKQ